MVGNDVRKSIVDMIRRILNNPLYVYFIGISALAAGVLLKISALTILGGITIIATAVYGVISFFLEK